MINFKFVIETAGKITLQIYYRYPKVNMRHWSNCGTALTQHWHNRVFYEINANNAPSRPEGAPNYTKKQQWHSCRPRRAAHPLYDPDTPGKCF